MTAENFVKTVKENKKYININNRAEVTQMLFLVRDLFRVNGNNEAVNIVEELIDECENMDTM